MKIFKRLSKVSILTMVMIFVLSLSVMAATPAPSKVANLRATSSGTTITLTWAKAANAYRYVVYRVDANGKAIAKVKTTSKNTLKIKKCKEGVTYNFRVRAYNRSKVNGDPSDMASVTINVKKPAAPKNFAVSTYGNNSVNFRWSKVSKVTGYALFKYDEATKEYKQMKVFSPKSKKGSIGGMVANKEYKFILKAYKKINGKVIYSDPSAVATAQITQMTAAANAVRAPRYTVKAKTAINAVTKNGTKVALASGTKFTVSSKSASTVTAYLSNGTVFKVARRLLRYYGLDCTPNSDYSQATKESFVNAKGLKSSSNYLVWVSEYKLKINVFQGSRGNWKLVKVFPCCVGKWSSRTAGGLRKILKKVYHGDYGAPYLYFSPGKGTHSNPQGCAFHNYVDGNRNKAVSHGCCRTARGNLIWMYNHLATGTTVYIH